MRRQFLYQRNEIKCLSCGTRIAFRRDYLLIVLNYIPGGIFDRVFNVEVSEDVNNYRVIDGNTLANTYCFQCGTLLGWQFIAVPQPSPSIYIRQGKFYMRLHELSYWNDEPLLHDLNEELDGLANELAPNEQVLGANEQNADQDGNANEQVPNEQDLGANEQNTDQDGGANEQVPNEQDLGANEQNADQDGEANGQVPNEQDVDANEQNPNQDGNGNEQNHDQDGGGNEQNHDEDGGAPTKRRKM